MFIDTAKINIKAGNGGNGSVSFHREKYVAAGGPDGGDGGRGGNVVFVADSNLSTLMDFRYKRKYAAQNGEDGRAARCSGKNAPDLIIRVPRGTLVRDAQSGLVIADISGDEPVVVARGGRGGWGNVHFATPTRQIPKFAKPGGKGEELEVRLELKLIADVGLVGFPNVGKSTIISVISAAKPKIANYHFTTLSPVLGVVRVGPEASFVAADIPGLIEGAADGVGLGHDFLRHVDRCRLLLHVVDVSGSEGRDPKDDFEKINTELANFSQELSARPQIVLGNKCDIASPEQIAEFRAFIARGNVMDMAVGVIIGAAFKAIIDSLVNDILMPFVGIFVKADSFAALSVQVGGATISYGAFLSAVVNFLIMALVIFILVRSINRAHDKLSAMKKAEEAPVEEPAQDVPAAPTEAELLTQILEELKKQNG